MTALKRALFREPRAGATGNGLFIIIADVGAAFGGLMVVDGVLLSDFSPAGGPSYSPMPVVLGFMFAFQFAAELLPKAWSTPAGLLRAGAICIAVVSLLPFLIL